MLYLEDEDNVRPSWMPYKNDYRHLNVEELGTIEDCDEALLWVSDRITDMHCWADTAQAKEDFETARRFKRHIGRAMKLKADINLLKNDFWQEEKREFWAENNARKKVLKAAAHTNQPSHTVQQFRDHLRDVITEHHGKEYWITIAKEAATRLDATKGGNQ